MPKDLEETIKLIKEKADIVQIVGSVLNLKKQGKDYFALCPFHADKDPSFSVVPAKQICHCFGCGETWDVIAFWQAFKGIKFMEALQEVGDMVGVPVGSGRGSSYKQYPATRKQQAWEPEIHYMPPDAWMTKALKFIIWGHDNLYTNQEAMAYLHRERGLNEKTIDDYGLGWCKGEGGRDLYRDREAWGLPPETNEKGIKKPLWFPVGMVLPYIMDRKVVKIRIRRPNPLKVFKGMRYYFLPGGAGFTTILNPGGRAFVIVEADLDAYLINQEAGDLVGVIPLGSSHAKPDKRAIDILRKSLFILNCLDFDNAGAKALTWWKKEFPDSRTWPVPEGKDPAEAWKRGVNIREWIRDGLPEGLKDA